MSGLTSQNLRVPKTIKLFIGGEFPRTESGRSYPVYEHGTKKVFAHLCRASRKDFRNAVAAAKAAQSSWEGKSAYNRGQILYRMAEMAESHRGDMTATMKTVNGMTEKAAEAAVDEIIDAFVYYSGFADKYSQVSGCVNPVSGPHHSFTTPEPVGCVVGLFDESAVVQSVVAAMAAIIATGNTLTVILPQSVAPLLAPLSEVLATSDLPKGVVNLLTGHMSELLEHVATHMEVQSVCYQGQDDSVMEKLQKAGADNMKRVVRLKDANLAYDRLAAFVEFKTVWHPIGH